MKRRRRKDDDDEPSRTVIQHCNACGFAVPLTEEGRKRMEEHYVNLECIPRFDDTVPPEGK